ncbi:MAG: hypothetical protein V1767_07565 [Chloroflexota bacterium]
MGMLAWIIGTLGFLSAVMGVLTALEIVPAVKDLPYMFWLTISMILVLISVAFAAGQRGKIE